jgi:hypothetical protein
MFAGRKRRADKWVFAVPASAADIGLTRVTYGVSRSIPRKKNYFLLPG